MEAAIAEAEAAVMSLARGAPGDVDGARARAGRPLRGDRRRGDPLARARPTAIRSCARSTETGSGCTASGWRRSSRRIWRPVPRRAAAPACALLATVTDVYVWQLLRRRAGPWPGGDRGGDAGLVDRAPRSAAREGARLHLAGPRPPQPDDGAAAGAAPRAAPRSTSARSRRRWTRCGRPGLECEADRPRDRGDRARRPPSQTQLAAGERAFATCGAAGAARGARTSKRRSPPSRPDLAMVDTTTFGAKAVAERERPALGGVAALPARRAGARGAAVRARVAAAGRAARAALRDACFGRPRRADSTASPAAGRQRRPPRRRPAAARLDRRGLRTAAPLTLYFTAEPFEYPRPLPPRVVMVGPGLWDPPPPPPFDLPEDERPLVLVACSSEFQDDGAIAAAALAGLRDR